jgi:hypothetical protein
MERLRRSAEFIRHTSLPPPPHRFTHRTSILFSIFPHPFQRVMTPILAKGVVLLHAFFIHPSQGCMPARAEACRHLPRSTPPHPPSAPAGCPAKYAGRAGGHPPQILRIYPYGMLREGGEAEAAAPLPPGEGRVREPLPRDKLPICPTKRKTSEFFENSEVSVINRFTVS